MLIISAVIWLAVLIFFKKNRIWIFYYMWGAVGSTILLILLLRGSPIEYTMEYLTGFILYKALILMKIQSYIFDNAPGTILVLLTVGKTWTTINIDIECSGVLESCVFIGLLLFYPVFTSTQKIVFSVLGISGLFVINLIRLLVIVIIMNQFGRDSIYLAHTLFGRMVFFVFVIVLYWYVFSRSSLAKIKEHKNA